MMLVVFAVTSATLYLAGKNLRAKQQETLETQFQNEVRSYLALQESRLSGINEKCKAFSHSVRIRAALEERDIDDLYRNALTELRNVLGPSDDNARISSETIRASFVRFLDPAGAVLPPDGQPIPIVDQPGVDPALEAAGAALRSAGQQSSGFIALNSERQLSALRQIVVTKSFFSSTKHSIAVTTMRFGSRSECRFARRSWTNCGGSSRQGGRTAAR